MEPKVYDLRGLKVVVKSGDLTEEDVDVIVVPANSLMIMGGGVAGAVRRRGGAEIEEEARRLAPVKIGEAIATGGGRLRCSYVIHSPTMERPADRTTPEVVYLATAAALKKARELGLRSIAFPGMGTGVGGVDPASAADAMLKAIVDEISSRSSVGEVRLVAFDSALMDAFVRAVERVIGKQ